MATPEKCPTAKMKTIVVASDGSEFSEKAVTEAIQWAKQFGGALHAVCTAQVSLGQLQYAAEVVSEIDRAARQTCEAVKSRAQAAGVNCEAIVHEGEEPYVHIVDAAEKLHADAIVVGRRGRRGLLKLLMGSVTHLVIGHAPCNVFIVPRGGGLKAKRILVATDGSPDSEKAAMEAISLAKLSKGSLIVCSVVHDVTTDESARDDVDKIKRIADAEQVEAEAVVRHGLAYQEIISAAQEYKADLIVMGTHGRTGFKKLLMGSQTERVIGMSDLSIMVVR
ncbi:universal stress protein [Kaarinaea lacus]